MDGTRLPNFLVIGAQRSGTTWLHRVLRQHPGLWLPPVKELHYFDRPHARRGSLRRGNWLLMAWLGLTTRDTWVLRYFLGERNDEWYARLFERAQAKGLIAGEITPAYAVLGDDVFCRIQRLNPEIKMVFVMRDPVERIWSAVNLELRSGRIPGPLTEEKSFGYARQHGTTLRSCYMDTIRRLERFFPASQLHFCFFDDLRERPASLIAHILEFLGADPNRISEMRLPQAVNSAAAGKPIPRAFERDMARQYLPVVEELCGRFEGPPHQWRARYERLLNGAS
jgi:hypothetical protein